MSGEKTGKQDLRQQLAYQSDLQLTEITKIKTEEEFKRLEKEGYNCSVYEFENDAYGFYATSIEYTDEEIDAAYKIAMLKTGETIKKCVVFFTVLAVIGLVIGVISGIMTALR